MPGKSHNQQFQLRTPSIEFPVTVCVVAFGPHPDLAKRFLDSLYRHTPVELFQLRVGLNEVSTGTERLFKAAANRYGNIRIYREPKNIFKSPLMRRLLYELPINTRWTLWCDDDALFTKSDWLHRLAWKIETAPDVVMWGKEHFALRDEPFLEQWIKSAHWFRHVPLRQHKDNNGTSGKLFCFAAGGFWAIRTEVLYQLDWPDKRLLQASDDLLLGEALRQNQLKLGNFTYGVEIHEIARRNPNAPAVSNLDATIQY
jgi:GT2 family glycosyltransferase